MGVSGYAVCGVHIYGGGYVTVVGVRRTMCIVRPSMYSTVRMYTHLCLFKGLRRAYNRSKLGVLSYSASVNPFYRLHTA